MNIIQLIQLTPRPYHRDLCVGTFDLVTPISPYQPLRNYPVFPDNLSEHLSKALAFLQSLPAYKNMF